MSKAILCRYRHHVEVVCPTCGNTFVAGVDRKGKPHKKYCSRDCAGNCPAKAEAARKKANEQWANDRAKMMAGIKMRSESEEWRSAAHFQKGEKHPRYLGNKRDRERNRYEYKAWRMSVFKRDGFACRDCGATKSRKLNAHHVRPWAKHPELRYDVANGITLCEPCHDKRHGKVKRPKTRTCVKCGAVKKTLYGKVCQKCRDYSGMSARSHLLRRRPSSRQICLF